MIEAVRRDTPGWCLLIFHRIQLMISQGNPANEHLSESSRQNVWPVSLTMPLSDMSPSGDNGGDGRQHKFRTTLISPG